MMQKWDVPSCLCNIITSGKENKNERTGRIEINILQVGKRNKKERKEVRRTHYFAFCRQVSDTASSPGFSSFSTKMALFLTHHTRRCGCGPKVRLSTDAPRRNARKDCPGIRGGVWCSLVRRGCWQPTNRRVTLRMGCPCIGAAWDFSASCDVAVLLIRPRWLR